MRFLAALSLLTSTLILCTVNAYESIDERSVDYDSLFARSQYSDLASRGEEFNDYQHWQRRSDFLSDLSTRELVKELGARLVRRKLTAAQKVQEVMKKSVPYTLVVRHDKAALSEFAKLARALTPPSSPRKATGKK